MSNDQNAPASTQLITVADRAAKAVSTAVANLQKASAELAQQASIFETLSADIQQKESQLANLDVQFDNAYRTKTAELNVRVLENGDGVLNTLLAERGLERISKIDVTQLRSDLSKATADNAEAIQSAVGAALSSAKAKHEAELATVNSNHAVETATLRAEAASKNERIEFLGGEIAALRKQLDDERNTRLAIAQADAGRQGVVVNAGK